MPSGICRAVSYRIRGFRMVNKVKSSVDPYGICKIDEEGLDIIGKIINDSELKWDEGVIGTGSDKPAGDNLKTDSSIRTCKTSFLPVHDELIEMFGRLVVDYNRNYSGWNYDIEFIESIQLSHYFEGHFYDWHVDSFVNPAIENNKPYNRKVSLTVFLNNPDEYEGGEFDLETRGPNTDWSKERFDKFKLPKGSVIVFPSHMWHRVRPVTSGVRKSLVIWIQGPPFK